MFERDYWSNQRLQIRRWLEESVSPVIANCYASIVQITHTADFPCRAEVVAHLGRALINRLPDSLGPSTYKQALTPRYDRCRPSINILAKLHDMSCNDLTESDTTISQYQDRLTAECLAEFEKSTERALEKQLRVFTQQFGAAGADRESVLPAALKLKKIHDQFMGVPVHLNPKKAGDWSRATALVAELESILLAFARSFFENKKRINEIISATNASAS